MLREIIVTMMRMMMKVYGDCGVYCELVLGLVAVVTTSASVLCRAYCWSMPSLAPGRGSIGLAIADS